MDKEKILLEIIATLSADLKTLTEAAKSAHTAATHTECLPDNKYDTTGLEASYIAQGQANRAQDIRRALECYRRLTIRTFGQDESIRLTALVILEADDGGRRKIFLGPEAGGMKLGGDKELIVITPESPLGRALLGKNYGDEINTGTGEARKEYTVVSVS